MGSGNNNTPSATGIETPWSAGSAFNPGQPAQEDQNAKGKNQAYNQQQYENAAHPNVNNSTGSQSWAYNPKTGQYSEQQGLSPSLSGAQSSLMNEAQTNAQNGVGTGDSARDQAITGAYNQATSRLDPQFQQEQEQLTQQLAAQGLDPTSQAAQTAQQNFGRQENDAYSSAMNNAIGQGTAAQSATFGENLAANNLPYQQLGALNSLLPGNDTSGLNALQGANTYTQQQNAAAGQTAGSVVGAVGSVAAMASDERVKDDVQDYDAQVIPGVPLSSFSYSADPTSKQYIGVTAQNLEKVAPDAVATGPDGVKRVAPQFAPVPASQAMGLLPDTSSLSPEDQQALFSLSTEESRRERNTRAKAQAEALRNLQLDTSGIKSVGEGIAKGLGNVFDRAGGAVRSSNADQQARDIDAQHTQGLRAFMGLGAPQPDGSADLLAGASGSGGVPMTGPDSRAMQPQTGMSADDLQQYPQALPPGLSRSQVIAALLRQPQQPQNPDAPDSHQFDMGANYG